MAKTRGVSIVKEDGKWCWMYANRRWEFRLEPYKRRGLWRDGVTIFSAIEMSLFQLLCPDDAVLFSIGYECAEANGANGGDAA